MVDAYSAAYLKKEVTYGTDAVPTAAANAILTRNFSASPLDNDKLERNLDKPSRGASPVAVTNQRSSFSFECELAGSGTAGTAPAWMELLEACGMSAPVLTATTKAEQKFAALGTNISSLTAYHYRGTERRKALGCRGDISAIDFTAGAYPFIGFNYIGLLPSLTPFDTAALGAPDYTRWRAPLEVNTGNTDFTLGGFPAVMRSLKLQANADVKARRLVGADYIQRGNHKMSGKAVIEMPATATKNYYTSLMNNEEVALQIIHGTVEGNIVQLDAAYVQILDIKDGVEDDVAMLEIDLQFNVRAGQDDLIITAK